MHESIQQSTLDPGILLRAVLTPRKGRTSALDVLAVEYGTSATRLAQQAVRSLSDPAVVAAYPAEVRRLRARLEARRGRRVTPRV